MAKIRNTAVFERREKKYTLTREQAGRLLRAIQPVTRPDQFGQYTIRNVYYDTDDYALIRHSLDKPAFKQKLRLRGYGIPKREDDVYLELKKKFDGITYKRRVKLPLWQAEAYLHGCGELPEQSQIAGEIDWFVQGYALSPKIVLCYDRIALQGVDDPELRITFDRRIRWRNHSLHLWRGDDGMLLLPDDTCIMEIKTRSALPFELSRQLAELGIYPSSFSKYGAVYQYLLHEQAEAVRYAG